MKFDKPKMEIIRYKNVIVTSMNNNPECAVDDCSVDGYSCEGPVCVEVDDVGICTVVVE